MQKYPSHKLTEFISLRAQIYTNIWDDFRQGITSKMFKTVR